MQRPTIDAWLFAGKTYLAAMLALFLSIELQLDRPGWAVTTVFITCQPFAGATQSKAVYRFLGTLLGAGASLALIPALVQTPVLLCVALAAWVAICLFISLQDRSPRSYIFMLAGYSAAFIAFPAVNAPLNIFDTSVARVEEISLGVLCSTIVQSTIFPNSIMRAVWDRVDGWLRHSRSWSARALEPRSSANASTNISAGVSQNFSALARKSAGYPLELDLLSAHLAYDTSALRGDVPTLQALQYRLELLLPILVSIEDRLDMFREQNIAVPVATQAFMARMRAALAAEGQLDFAALRAELAEVAETHQQLNDWNDILQAALVARLMELLNTLRACDALRKRLVIAEHPESSETSRKPKRHKRPVRRTRHIDQGLAVLSSVTAFISILAGCAVWIETGWADGGSVPMIAAVGCSFFAAQDSPLPSMAKFAKFAIVAAAISLIYSATLLPRANSFEIAALMLAPVFIWLGLLIAKPATSFIGMVVSTNLATLIGLNNEYVGDFIVSLNSAFALITGIVLTAVIMSVIRARTPAWSARRILKAARKDLIDTLETTHLARSHHQTKNAFVHRMLDRLHVVMPRLSDIKMTGEVGAADLLPELRLGANAIDIDRLRHRLPPALDADVVALTREIAAYLRAQALDPALKPSEGLRYRFDQLLSAAMHAATDYRQTLLLAISGMRVVLFRNP